MNHGRQGPQSFLQIGLVPFDFVMVSENTLSLSHLSVWEYRELVCLYCMFVIQNLRKDLISELLGDHSWSISRKETISFSRPGFGTLLSLCVFISVAHYQMNSSSGSLQPARRHLTEICGNFFFFGNQRLVILLMHPLCNFPSLMHPLTQKAWHGNDLKRLSRIHFSKESLIFLSFLDAEGSCFAYLNSGHLDLQSWLRILIWLFICFLNSSF